MLGPGRSMQPLDEMTIMIISDVGGPPFARAHRGAHRHRPRLAARTRPNSLRKRAPRATAERILMIAFEGGGGVEVAQVPMLCF